MSAEILIIEDVAAVLLSLRIILSGAGHQVSCAPDGNAGLALLKSKRSDLVISDIWMPDMGGTDVIAQGRRLAPRTRFLAITTNAAAAMEGNGVITITLSETANNAADLQPGAPRRFIRLCVPDTGCGMDTETLDRAFEPFFTTKQVGQGTGLGLFVGFSLVEEMAGSITAGERGGGGHHRDHAPSRCGAGG